MPCLNREAGIILDLNTIFFFGILVQLGVVLARVCVQRFGKTYPGFGQWTLASAALTAGFLAFATRTHQHPSLGIMLAFALLIAVSPLNLDGTVRFLMSDARPLRIATLTIAVLWIAAFETAYLLGASSQTLVIVISGSLVFFNLATLAIVARALRQGGLSTLWLIVGCLVLALAQHSFRLVSVLIDPAAGDRFTSNAGLAWTCIGATLLVMLTAIAQLTLNAQRVRSDLEAAQHGLEQLAWTDTLTGLNNRRSFTEKGMALIDSACRHDRPLALLMCDIDHFKRVNDSYGHGVGDQVLATVARTMGEMARLSDCAGRLGGEEFAILLAETDLATAEHVAERFRAAIEAIPPFDPGPEQITISIGVAAFDKEGDTLGLLIDRADQALYRAKNAGRNRCVTA